MEITCRRKILTQTMALFTIFRHSLNSSMNKIIKLTQAFFIKSISHPMPMFIHKTVHRPIRSIVKTPRSPLSQTAGDRVRYCHISPYVGRRPSVYATASFQPALMLRRVDLGTVTRHGKRQRIVTSRCQKSLQKRLSRQQSADFVKRAARGRLLIRFGVWPRVWPLQVFGDVQFS